MKKVEFIMKQAAVGLVAAMSLAASAENFNDRAKSLPWGQTFNVDSYWEKDTPELRKWRVQRPIDSCLIPDSDYATFGRAIEKSLRISLDAKKIKSSDYINGIYGIRSESEAQAVGFLSHPLCVQEKEELSHLLGSAFVPDSEGLQALQRFAIASNSDRDKALQGDQKALESFVDRWSTLMGCLSYAESLGGDEAYFEKSDEAFAVAMSKQPEVKPFFTNSSGDLIRPTGVLFHNDRNGGYFIEMRKAQANGSWKSSSVRNALDKKYPTWPVVGLFQFKPQASSNVGQCIEEWNEVMKGKQGCQVDRRDDDEIIKAFGSFGQSMNAFCGVHKILQSFNSQVNTTRYQGTDLSNRVNGKLKAPADRCVSLMSASGTFHKSSSGKTYKVARIYSHFGPLRNSVKTNFNKVIQCAVGVMKD